MGYSPLGCKELDTTEQLSMHTHREGNLEFCQIIRIVKLVKLLLYREFRAVYCLTAGTVACQVPSTLLPVGSLDISFFHLLFPSPTVVPLCPELSVVLLLLLSCFSCVRLCATPETAAHQASRSLVFSRQEHCSGLPFPSPMHESEK